MKEQIWDYPKIFLVTLIRGLTAAVLVYELSKTDYDAFKKNADRPTEAIAKFYAAD